MWSLLFFKHEYDIRRTLSLQESFPTQTKYF